MTLVPHLDAGWPAADPDTGQHTEEAHILHRLVEEVGIPSIVLVAPELAGTGVPGGVVFNGETADESGWEDIHVGFDHALAALPPTPYRRIIVTADEFDPIPDAEGVVERANARIAAEATIRFAPVDPPEPEHRDEETA